MNYQAFIETKRDIAQTAGLHVPPADLHASLFPFQRAVTAWALRRGRAAIFADTGMGKTRMQTEWARHVQAHTGGMVLILAPLMVGLQTSHEADAIGLAAPYVKAMPSVPGVYVTNYDRMDAFDLSAFVGLVLDESSILKGIGGKTRAALLERAQSIPFRLSCTATPSPNDFMEFGGQSEFLGIMPHVEMLATYFIHDGGDTSKWRLKGHGKSGFWKWISTWAAYFRKPSDLGFPDDDFALPPLSYREHTVDGGETLDGMLFPVQAETLSERITARRQTVEARCAKAAELANASNEQWIIWCNLNDESAQLTQSITGAVEVAGAHSADEKESRLQSFLSGNARVLVTKPTVAGFGLNMQNCRNMAFVGLNDSYEQMYQAVRRCWRYGQKRPVEVHLIAAVIEGAVVANIRRKEAQAEQLQTEMSAHMEDLTRQEILSETRPERENDGILDESSGTGWTVKLGDCVDVARFLPSDSIGFSVFSPPFASLYTYSASERDMGNCKNADEFYRHFEYLVPELYRVLQPGRSVAIHCMEIPLMKERDGVIGLRDFPGELIAMFQRHGFIFHSRVAIWKNPVTQMQRTKALGLLHKTIRTDSSMSRVGLPDYLVVMRKPGENANPISHDREDFTVDQWQAWASPIWTDIRETHVLKNYREGRESDDEKHIAPLQLDVIERALVLWSNPDDLVFSPFTGIGSEGYMAVRLGRRFLGAELKRSYWEIATKNIAGAQNQTVLLDLA